MHILIGVITALAGLIWALYRLHDAGVNLNAFNPFTWHRRRQWEKKLGTKPMHALTNSMDAAALLIYAIAKAKGEITRETKTEILNLFESEFGVSGEKADELFSASSHMVEDAMNMAAEVRHILAPTYEEFTDAQVQKLLDMLNAVSVLEGSTNETQSKIIEAVKQVFKLQEEQPKNW